MLLKFTRKLLYFEAPMCSKFIFSIVLAATIMGAVSGFVNASPVVFTEKKPSHKDANPRALTLKEFVHRMLATAANDQLVPDQAQVHHLEPLAPIKLLSARSGGQEWTDKWCDLVLDPSSEKHAPRCFVLIVRRRDGVIVSFKSYRLDLNGKLESAYLYTGRLDANGKPIRGSSAGRPLDASSKDVQREAKDELVFWLTQQAEGSQ